MGATCLSCVRQLRVLATAAGAAAALCASPSIAREKTATTEVLLRVQSTCQVQAGWLNFGFPPKGATTAVAATTVTVRCTPGVAYRVGIDEGLHFDGTSRRMYGGQAQGKVWYATYRIYRDAARLLPWGDSPLDSAFGTMPLTGTTVLPVFGTADLKNVRAAEYRDTVTVTLEF